MTYLTPADVTISDDWHAHHARDSAEPGTDYETPYGTPFRVADDGIVMVVDRDPSGAEGRRLTVALMDGRIVSYIHLSEINVAHGAWVGRGRIVGKTGASGFGKDRYYDPHVHVSLWERPRMAFKNTIDFEKFTVPQEEKENEPMIVNIQGKEKHRNGGAYYIADGVATFLGGFVTGAPTLSSENADALAKRVKGI